MIDDFTECIPSVFANKSKFYPTLFSTIYTVIY